MSIKVMAEVWDNAPCAGGELLFLLALADQAGDLDRCAWPGMAQLQRRTRSSRRSVYRYAESLQQRQIIVPVDPDEAAKKITRFPKARHGGHTTVVWRIRPLDEWPSLWDVSPETSQVVEWGASLTPQEEPETTRGRRTRGASAHAPEVSPVAQDSSTRTTKENRKNKTTTSSRSSRRAARERDEAEWTDPAAAVFAREQEPEETPVNRKIQRSPDSAWSLNGYYRQAVFIAGTGRVGNTNDGAMRKFFAAARKAGVTADTLRAMVDCFVDDPHLFHRTRTHRWKTFIANAPLLQERAENLVRYIQGEGDELVPIRSSGPRGSVPKAVLDKILAEVG